MYGMTNYEKLFAYELTNCLIDASGFKLSQCHIYIYYKYEPDGSKLVVLYYVDDCVYWYIKMVFGYYWKEVLCEIIRICTLVYVHYYITT